jgi:hypothetical protein
VKVMRSVAPLFSPTSRPQLSHTRTVFLAMETSRGKRGTERA